MRRFGCVSTGQVSYCGLLLSNRAITPTPTKSSQQMRTASSKVVGGDVASSAACASSSPSPSATTTSATLAAAAPPAAILYASSFTASPAPAAAAPSASLADMTERLRVALRALSEVERAKAEQSQGTTSTPTTFAQTSSTSPGGGRVEPPSLASAMVSGVSVALAAASATSPVAESRAGGVGATTNTSGASSRGPRAGSDENAVATTNPTSIPNDGRATTLMPSSSPSWIRNKKPKFWALVNEAGADDVGYSGKGQGPATTTTTTGADSIVAASRATEASSASTTASAPPVSTSRALPSQPSVLSAGVAPTATEHSHVAALGESQGAALGTPTASLPSCPVAGTLASSDLGGTKKVASLSSPRATGGTLTVHSVRISTSVSPFRNRYKRDVAHVLSELLNSDPTLGPQLLGQLSAESRRLLLIMGAASEYFGVDYEEVAEQVKEADTDRDNSISSKEYDAWARRIANSTPAKRRHAKDGQTSADTAVPELPLDTVQGDAASPLSMPPEGPLGSSRDALQASSSPEAPVSHSTSVLSSVTESATRSRQTAEAVAASAKAAPGSRDAVGDGAAAAGSCTVPFSMPSPAPSPLEGSDSRTCGGGISGVDGDGAVASPSPPSTPLSAVGTGAASASIKQAPNFIPWRTYLRIIVAAAPPFLAFGMLDNSILVLAGGAIDNALSDSLGLSQMAAAALGGVVSGVAGIQVHGLAERYTRVAPPQLTAEQQHSDSYSRATQAGITLGMVLGLIIGMTPLLFMAGSTQLAEQEERDRHHFQEEAVRSYQRRCMTMQREEAAQRQQLMREEERAMREVLLQRGNHHPAQTP
ncbi:hypothetical protein JKF63_07898 [Porcisia hertigi]|uniref:EF-hand domain-containing protein n=1 Tax=Porcisia hertigi TaxID=2761500 RepID=A0A836YID0_9TRYP|nr:hypothetical protein JKF63_07898 [Porcisia hertigi]